MYDSGITIASLISQINSEADIATDIPDTTYLRLINAFQQLVYSEFIEDYRSATITSSGNITLSGITVGAGEAAVKYDDIIKVYAGDNELTKSGVITSISIPDKDIYYSSGTNVIIVSTSVYDTVKVVYRARPAISAAVTDNVYVPYEWLELLAAKVRGEIYKIANEDNLAAKWLADYNTQLESFKAWAAKKNIRYGE